MNVMNIQVFVQAQITRCIVMTCTNGISKVSSARRANIHSSNKAIVTPSSLYLFYSQVKFSKLHLFCIWQA